MKFYKKRSFKYGMASAVLSVLLLVLVVLINVLAGYLTEKYSLKLDLTADKAFTLSDKTLQFLSGLDREVEIYVLSPESEFSMYDDYFYQANAVLRNFEKNSDKIALNYIDLRQNPGFLKLYPQYELSENLIVVKSGDKSALLTPYSLFNMDEIVTEEGIQPYIISSKAEQAVASAVLNIITDKKINVGIVMGHEEKDIAVFRSVLEANSYEIYEINTQNEEIPPEVDLLIMAAPLRDITAAESKKLESFLADISKMHSLVYFASSDQPALSNMEALLNDWNISVSPGTVFEANPEYTAYLDQFTPFVFYTENYYSQNVLGKGVYPVLPFAKPMKTADFDKSIDTSVLAVFSGSSGIAPDASEEVKEAEITGESPALILSRSARGGNVLAVGSCFSLAYDFVNNYNFANGDYFLDIFAVLTEKEEVLRIEDKTLEGALLDITTAGVMATGTVTVVIIPLAVLAAGIFIWFKRRSL